MSRTSATVKPIGTGRCLFAVEEQRQGPRDHRGGRLTAALVILAIGFLLLAPDPHDHGDAGSLGGLLRLFLPDLHHVDNSHQPGDESESATNGSCPIHFWHQVAATGLLTVLLLRFALRSLLYISVFVNPCSITDLDLFHSRAPPVFPS